MNTAELLWADSGFDIAGQVERALRQFQNGDPLREVIILCPPGPTAGTLRRRLPHCGDGKGVASVRFTTAVDYALELSPLAIRSQRPITPQLLSAAIREQLNDQCPPELESVKHHRSTLDALVQAAERLRNVSLAPDAMNVISELAAGNRTRRAMADVALRARQVVATAGLRDEPTLLAAATEALGGETTESQLAAVVLPPMVLPPMVLPPMILVMSECVHPGQIPFLSTLVRSNPRTAIVALVPEAADEALRHQISAVAGCNSQPFHTPTSPVPSPDRVVSCPDQDEEVRQVVRMVATAITTVDATQRLAAHRIVVLHPPIDGYARSLAEEFDRANIAWTGPAPGLLNSSIAGQATRFLLDCFGRNDRGNVFRLLDIAPFWTGQRAYRRPVAQWQETCREIGLVTASDWAEAPERLRRQQQAKRERFGPNDDLDQKAQDSLGRLLEIVFEIDRVQAAAQRATDWATATKQFIKLLERHIGTEAWRQLHWPSSDSPSGGVRSWQLRAAAQITQLISGLATLDDPAFAVRYRHGDLPAIVEGLLDRPLGREGDATSGVRILNIAHGVCLDADLIVVVGVNDGILPSSPSEDLLIRQDLSERCARWIEPSNWQTLRAQRAWSSALRSPTAVVATFSRRDLRRGGELYKSAWLADATQTEHHASHHAGIIGGQPLTTAEMVLSHQAGPLHYRLARRRALAIQSRLQPEPTEFDGQIGVYEVLSPVLKEQSISRFEKLASCGIAYFVRYALGVNEIADAAEISSIEPMDKGNLIHGVLEALVIEWLRIDAARRPPWLDGAHFEQCLRRSVELIDERAAALRGDNRLGHETSWLIERKMIQAAVAQTLVHDRDHGVVPVAAEHAFGSRDLYPALTIETPIGAVSFQGKIDRIDRIAGQLTVSDFKTTNAAEPRKNTPRATDPTLGGTKLQLPLYALVAARDFAHIDDDADHRYARYIYLRRSESIADELPDAAHEAFLHDVQRLAITMRDGDFRPHAPHAKWGCPACSPDGLGLEVIGMRAEWWGEDSYEIDE